MTDDSVIGPPDDLDLSFPTTTPTEPATKTGSLVGLGTLIVNGLVLFGVPLDTQQKIYVIGAVSILAPLLAGILIRSKVFSPASFEEMVDRLTHRVGEAEREAERVRSAAQAQRMAHDIALAAVKATVVDTLQFTPQRRQGYDPTQAQRPQETPTSFVEPRRYPDPPAPAQAPAQQPNWPSMDGYAPLPLPPQAAAPEPEARHRYRG